MTDHPTLSIVTTSRNDDHGGRLAQRTQRHIDCLYQQAHNYQIPVEYLLVEWNPPQDRPPITGAVHFYHTTPYWHPKIITVPFDVHQRFRYHDRLAIYQMIAKNIGIRRSTGDFVLCTNIDILFSDEMFLFVTGTLLGRNRFYRCDRFDVGPDVPDATREKMFQYCTRHILRQCRRGYIVDFSKYGATRLATQVYAKTRNAITHQIIGRPLIRLFGECALSKEVPDIHTMACGDFTMMHRDDWFGLRGYPEMEIFSIHIDSLLLVQAYYSGLSEYMVPFPIYHIEHSIGTSLVPGGDIEMYENLGKRGIPYLPLSAISLAAADMLYERPASDYKKVGSYWIYKKNKPDWGLASDNLAVTEP